MAEYAPVDLRLAPHAIPAMITAFDLALAEIGPSIDRLRKVGHIRGPWMGDPKSEEIVAFYNTRVMDAVDGPFQALVLYERELIRVRDQLQAMEQEYQRTEGENVAVQRPVP